MTHTLTINGVAKAVAGWGIETFSLKLKRVSFDADLLTFTIKPENPLTVPAIAYGEYIEYHQDGVRRFAGWIRDVIPTLLAGESIVNFVAKNVWHELEVMVYDQERNTKSADDGFTSPIRRRTTLVILGLNLDDGKIDTKTQMEVLLDWALAPTLGNLGAYLQYDVDFAGLVPPFQERENITIATGMRAMGALTPDCVTWMDYETTPPTLYVRRRATETPLTIDCTGGAPLVGVIALKERHDLKPVGVEIDVVSEVTNPLDGYRYAAIERFQAGATAARARLIRPTISLKGALSEAPESTPEDLAAAYWAALQDPFYEGRAPFVRSEVTYRPGNLLNFSNGWPAWATAKAIVQAVTETPFRQLQEVECGPPPMLLTGSWAEINRRFNNNYQDTGLLGGFYSGAPSGLPTAPHNPTTNAGDIPNGLQCEQKTTTATLIGYSEFADPTEPPKKYLTLTASGSWALSRYDDAGCTNPNSTPNGTGTYSGVRTYDPDTGIASGALTINSSISGSSDVSGMTVVPPGVGYQVANSKTESNTSTDGSCANGGSGVWTKYTSTSVKTVLTSEDTEEAAIARAEGATAWSGSCESGTAFKTVRGPGVFTLSIRNVRVRASWAADPTRSYIITFQWGRRPIGSNAAFAALYSQVIELTADTANETSEWVMIPNDAGYETRCIGLDIAIVAVP